MRPACSIVIPTWNASALTSRCLGSLRDAIQPGYDEIIVIDDGSTDGTREMIAEKHPDVVLEVMERNAGFGEAVNKGVSCSQYSVVVLLNNDIVVEPEFLSHLLTHFDKKDVFAVNCRVYQSNGSRPGGGLVRGFFHCGLMRLRWAEDEVYREHCVATLYANGAATAICKEKFEALEGFDSLYKPFYSEDLDLSYRAHQRGWRVMYEPRSVVRHDHGATISRDYAPEFVRCVSLRNRIIFVLRNVRDPGRLISSCAWMFLRLIGGLLTGKTEFARALFGAMRSIPQIRQRRRADRCIAKSDAAIVAETSRWFSPEQGDGAV